MIDLQSINLAVLPIAGGSSRTGGAVPAMGSATASPRVRKACSAGNEDVEAVKALATPRGSHRICPRQSKEQWKMKWLKKDRKPELEPAEKPVAKAEAPKKTLQIEELEERITPNAIWGD